MNWNEKLLNSHGLTKSHFIHCCGMKFGEFFLPNPDFHVKLSICHLWLLLRNFFIIIIIFFSSLTPPIVLLCLGVCWKNLHIAWFWLMTFDEIHGGPNGFVLSDCWYAPLDTSQTTVYSSKTTLYLCLWPLSVL